MSAYNVKALRRAGAWNIVMGVVALAAGISIGVGCLVAGGSVLRNSH